jgi:peptide/nickel transport system permease protein
MIEHAPEDGRAKAPTLLAWRLFRENGAASWALAVFALVALACALAPLLAPYPFDRIDLDQLRQPPSLGHPMGTDDLGRDVFTRILFAGRVSLFIGVLAALLAAALGTLVGALAGFYGRLVDNLLMRGTDVAYALPALPLLIILGSYSKAAVSSIALIVALLSWMATARVVRARVLTLPEMPYVEAARAMGATDYRLITRHVLPNAWGPIVVGATLAVGQAILVESALSFLGLGVQPPTPTWGNMLMDAQATMATKPWLTLFPGLAILVVVLATNFIGEGLQEALDPAGRDA